MIEEQDYGQLQLDPSMKDDDRKCTFNKKVF
jgi:hypothetical protein